MSSAGIQWKGTSTCIDFSCPDCDRFTHYCPESPFSGAIKCSLCNGIWILSNRVDVRRPGREMDEWKLDYAVEGEE